MYTNEHSEEMQESYKTEEEPANIPTNKEVTHVAEDAVAIQKKIQSLKEELATLTEAKARIHRLQETYGVPDEALTDSDAAILYRSEDELREELATLTKAVRTSPKGVVRALKKIAALFSL